MDSHVLVIVSRSGLEVNEIVGIADTIYGSELVGGVRICRVDFGEEVFGEEKLTDVGNIAAFVGGGFGVDGATDMAGDLRKVRGGGGDGGMDDEDLRGYG